MKIRTNGNLTNDENDVIVNIRLFSYHIQITKDCVITFCKNEYHSNFKEGIFKIYKLNLWKIK